MLQFSRHTFRILLITLFLIPYSVSANQEFIDSRNQAPCNPLSNGFCGLPYPSNHYSYENTASATGKTLYIPDSIFNESFYTNYGENMRPSRVMKGLSGYSALTAVLFEIPRDYDSSTLPQEGGESLVIFDMTTGQRLPFLVRAMDFANRTDETREQIVIQAYPRGRWPFSHQVLAVLTNKLVREEGQAIQASKGVRDALSTSNTDFKYIQQFLKSKNISASDVISFTHFQVRDQASVTQPTIDFFEKIKTDSHPIKITSINYPWFGSVAAEIKGQVKTSDFRLEDGRVDFTHNPTTKPDWIDFTLILPQLAQEKPVPLIIYGHGFGGDKDRAINMAKSFGVIDQGVAVIAISFPYSGTRVAEGGKPFTDLFKTQNNYTKITGAINQANFDLYSLSLAVQRHLKSLDVLPALDSKQQEILIKEGRSKADGIAELDLNQMYYMGISMGTMFGPTFAALDPNIKGAFLELAGGNIGMIINASTITEYIHNSSSRLRRFSLDEYFENTGFLPLEFSPPEIAVAFNLVLHRSDYGDNLNFSHLFSESPSGEEKSLAINYGIDDQIVPNLGAYSLASIAGVELSGMDKEKLRELEDNQIVAFASNIPLSEKNNHPGSGLFRSENIVPEFFEDNILGKLLSHITAKGSASNKLALAHWIGAFNTKTEIVKEN